MMVILSASESEEDDVRSMFLGVGEGFGGGGVSGIEERDGGDGGGGVKDLVLCGGVGGNRRGDC